MGQNEFDKRMEDADWERVFARQAMRAPLVETWFDLLELRLGSRLGDLGCGPGYVALRAALRVGRAGRILAVDRASGALAFLEGLRTGYDLSQILPIQSDIAALGVLPEPVDALLLAMMLHHTDDPGIILQCLPPLLEGVGGRKVLIAEFHPEGPCESGPPQPNRIHPETLARLCARVGLRVLHSLRQSPEHYLLLTAI